MRDQVHNLQGQLEQQAHTIEQLQNQQKTFYADLDRRLAVLEPSTKVVSSTTSNSAEHSQSTGYPTKTIHSKKEGVHHHSSPSRTSSAASGSKKHFKMAKK